jgi:hypothetical protein
MQGLHVLLSAVADATARQPDLVAGAGGPRGAVADEAGLPPPSPPKAL